MVEKDLITQIKSINEVEKGLQGELYISDRSLATSIFLSLKLNKPLFLEGEAGVGKTEIAKVLSNFLGRRLIGFNVTKDLISIQLFMNGTIADKCFRFDFWKLQAL